VRGHLHVTPSYFFEFEDGEPFYPISAVNKPEALEDRWSGGADPYFYTTTVPLYLQTLANHGFNTMRVYTSRDSLSLQYAEANKWPDQGNDFVTTTVQALDKYFNKLEDKGFVYSLANYDAYALGAWFSIYNDDRTSRGIPTDSRYLVRGTPPFPKDALPSSYTGTVPVTTMTLFFYADAGARTAQRDFKHSLGRFLDSQHASPKWWTRKGLIGWDLFSELDDPEVGWKWNEPASSTIVLRETAMDDWMATMAGYMGDTETLRLGSRRLRSVNVGNLHRYNWWDPERAKPNPNANLLQALYLDNPLNDYIDYHLYTWTGWDPSVWFTEYPSDSYTPMKYYLGVNVGVQQDLRASSCTLPEVIDHNRYAPGGGHRLGGFFSSEFGLPRWDDPTTRGYARKRLINDCYHNYLWLGMATGSVGGPTPLWPPRSWWRKYYDLSGITYLNPFGESLNCYTDEILDSMLSLSRFTSLVQWKFMRDSYRPVRVQHQSSDTTITLRVSQGGSQLSQNDWLWTAASDTTFTVGWIVRNCPRDYTIPESQNALTTATAPWLHIQHLAQIPLELVWFDDHLGQIVGSRSYSTSGTFNVVTPNTEGKNGFARSLAFLIQPTGLTASKSYAALPDEKIGMIGAAPLDTNEKWYEEGQKVLSGPLTFTVRTKPATNPSGLTFEWRFDSDTTAPIVVSGEDHIHRTYTASEEWRFVKVDIKDQQNKRVSGDITYVWVNPN
jgi:hypothetical protein